jgi:serine protease Do
MKILVAVVLIIMVIWSVIGSVLLFDTRSNLNSAQSDISTLKGELANPGVSPVVPPTSTAVKPQPVVSSIPDLVSKFEPAIVRIDVSGQGFQASGSGFVIDTRGYILTNQHVIDAARTIEITLMNGQTSSASVASSDANIDLAILKLNSNITLSEAVPLGKASDVLVGQEVVAMGFPLGTDLPGPASFTRGIVSAMRDMNGQRFIQTDVAINVGSSGGCLVNLSGKVIGVTTAAILPANTDAEGVGLAIPADTIQTFVTNNLK